MKPSTIAFLAMLVLSSQAFAQGEIYSCVDSNGKTEFTNVANPRNIPKGCKRLDLPNLTVIPAPAKRTAVQTVAAKPASSQPDFPKVDGETQKARDNDRRQILLDEMKSEEQKLANLRKDFNNGEPERHGDERNYAKYQDRVNAMKDDIARTEKNIEALKRELNNIK